MNEDSVNGALVTRLQDLLLDSHDVEVFLNHLVKLAQEVLSDVSPMHTAVTLERHGQKTTVASSDDTAAELDEVQFGYGAGPCLHALRTGNTVLVSDVEHEHRWPEYCETMKAKGIRSILGIPLPLEVDAGAGLNCYSRDPDAFSAEAIAKAEAFAAHASKALILAVRTAVATDRSENLAAALESRTTIDLAVGIIMAQSSCSQEAAVTVLKRASSSRNEKLRDVAAQIVARFNDHEPVTHFV